MRNEDRFSFPNGDDIREWIQENYVVVIVAMMVMSIVLSVIDFVIRRQN